MKFTFFIVFILIFGCGNNLEKKRPFNIPENSIWKGGSDGGCWISIVFFKDSLMKAVIYYENGEKWAEGEFEKRGSCDLSEKELVNEIVGYDGVNLITRNDCSFVRK
jgi:hypothetical protein